MWMTGKRVFLLTLTLLWAVSENAAMAADRDGAVSRHTLDHNGITRSYVVRLPHGVGQSSQRAPLVLVLHGGGGNADYAEKMTGFTALGRKEGFIVVYPEGTSRFKDRLLTWNAGHCCGYAMEQKIDDVGFIAALIDRLSEDYPVDHRRIYATGMSNGGMMTHRIGIELSPRLAAIAPVVATLFGDEQKPARPVSALMFNGMLDKSVPYLGGPPGGLFLRAWDGTPAKPALVQAVFWAEANGCKGAPGLSERGAVMLRKYSCPAGRAVELYLIRDHGHAWPGGQSDSRSGDKPGAAINATRVIWSFFKAHPQR